MNTYYTRAQKERPDGRPVDAVAPAPIPPEVAETLSHLAHLIDHSIAVRGTQIGVREFAARELDIPVGEIAIESRSLFGIDAALVGLALADAIDRFDPAAVIGDEPDQAPQWRAIDDSDETRRYPVNVHAVFPAGTFAPPGLIIGITSNWRAVELVVYSARRHAVDARKAIEDVVAVGREMANPFRGKFVSVTVQGGIGRVQIEPLDAATRSDLVISDAVWDEIDLNVGGMFAVLESFESAALSTNRGVLLYGPPGTGKTGIIRVLANELVGDVTVLLADSGILENPELLYEIAAAMSPAVVVLEDLDRVITGDGGVARDLLNTLDGAISAHSGVVTIATANEPRRFDPALLRSSRFDAKIEVPLPSVDGREAILRRYLSDTDLDVDARQVALAARGASGADLKGLVGVAILQQERNGDVTTASMVEAVRRRHGTNAAGQYL